VNAAGNQSTYFNTPNAIDFTVVGSTTFAYVTNSGNNTISKCSVNPATGEFSSGCETNTIETSSNDIAFTEIQNQVYAYLTFPNADNIPNLQLCLVSSSGALTNCQNALGDPTSVTLVNQAPVGATASALVTEVGGSGVLTCAINTVTNPWQIGPCTDAGTGFLFSAPQTLVVQTFNDTDYYAYIVDNDLQTVTQCGLTATGTLNKNSCQDSGASELDFVPTSISFTQLEDDNIYAYINDNENLHTTQCLVSQESPTMGLFSECVATGLPILTQPLAITFDDYSYIPDSATGVLAVCNPLENGTFQFCKDSGLGSYFNQPSAIAFNLNANDDLLAYIADSSTNNLVACMVNQTTGLLSSSSCFNPGFNFNQPVGITFNDLTGITYAYITNSGSSGSEANSIYQCTLNPDGTFANCFNADETDSFSTPINIQFSE
jgi:hypothetical protein